MTPQSVFLVVVVGVVAVVLLPGATTGTQHLVGDYEGWRPGFDYNAWARGRVFRVGDTLVFNYPKGKHNVYKVTGPEFMGCTVPVNTYPFASGQDVITLAAEGRKWYICGVAGHCQMGQKLVITVFPSQAEAPTSAEGELPLTTAPAPAPAYYGDGEERLG